MDRDGEGGGVADKVFSRPMTEEASTCHSGCHKEDFHVLYLSSIWIVFLFFQLFALTLYKAL